MHSLLLFFFLLIFLIFIRNLFHTKVYLMFVVEISEFFFPILGVLFLLLLITLCEVFLGCMELLSLFGLDIVLSLKSSVVLFRIFQSVADQLHP